MTDGEWIYPESPGVTSRHLIVAHPEPKVLGGVMNAAGTADTSAVVLSGRCGECGYLLTAPGHEITCGTMAP